jgi:hypothetical protein
VREIGGCGRGLHLFDSMSFGVAVLESPNTGLMREESNNGQEKEDRSESEAKQQAHFEVSASARSASANR